METATCIIALKDGDKVWMGADSAGTNSANLKIWTRSDEKIFIKEDRLKTKWLFGFSGSYRMGQIIRYMLELPEYNEEATKDPFAFIVRKFIPAFQKCLTENNYEAKDKDGHPMSGGDFLVAIYGNLFCVTQGFQVEVISADYNAAGCGEHLAFGAMYATKGQPAKQRIMTALEAAEEFSAGVRRPFIIYHT